MDVDQKKFIEERKNLQFVYLVAADAFTGDSGLIVLNDLRERKLDLAILKSSSSKEKLLEENRVLDYIGVPQIILMPTFDSDKQQVLNQSPL